MDRRVQRAELEEGLVAEPGEYPPLGQKYTVFDRSLVAGFPWACRDHDGAVVGGEILVGAIDVGLVAAEAGDGALQLGTATNSSTGRSSPVRRSTSVGRFPEKSMNVFSPARCTCRIDGRSRFAHWR